MNPEEQVALVNVERMIRVHVTQICQALQIHNVDLVTFTYEACDGDWGWTCRIPPLHGGKGKLTLPCGIRGSGRDLQEAREELLKDFARAMQLQEHDKQQAKARALRKKTQRMQKDPS